MDFDHVHSAEHPDESSVGRSVAVAIAKHPADVGMIHLNQFFAAAIPQSQALDLNCGIVVKRGRTVVLGVGPNHQRKSVLMVQRQRAPGQLHADTGRHESLGTQTLQVRIIR